MYQEPFIFVQIQKLIAVRGFKQRTAAKSLVVTQPRVSNPLRGQIGLFSTEALIDILARLDGSAGGVRRLLQYVS
ncbi:MAG: XRE family transcriptional regulator [Nitrospiraceae bacterium]